MEQNFNLYHIFYTVAKCRNISGAARELYTRHFQGDLQA